MEPNPSENSANLSFFGSDVSQGVSRGDVQYAATVETHIRIEIDQEVANLLNWLAKQQGISPELALKKAVATSAYLHDITTSQGGRLLVHRKDNSIGELVLK
jgi:hypothetical protein